MITNTLEKQAPSLSLHTVLIRFYAVLIFCAPLVSMGQHWQDSTLGQTLYIQSICGLMVCLWLLESILSKNWLIQKNKFYLPILALLSWSWLSLTWASNISEGLDIAMQWSACAIIFFVLSQSIQSNKDFSIILLALLSSFAVIILIALIQYFNPNFNFFPQAIAPAGTFGNKNFLIDYVIIVLPIPLYFFLNEPRFIFKIFAGILFFAAILLILLAKTRAGLLALPIMLTLFSGLIYFKFKKMFFTKQIIALTIGIIFVTCLVLFLLSIANSKYNEFSEIGGRIKSIFVLPEKDRIALTNSEPKEQLYTVIDSTTIRLITWLNTLKMIQEKPILGVGLNNWQVHYGAYASAYIPDPSYQTTITLRHVHNDYLQILADLGFIGFLIFLWLGIIIFKKFVGALNAPQEQTSIPLKAISLFISIVGLCIVSFFSIVWEKAAPVFVLFIILALLSTLSNKSNNEAGNLIKLNEYFAKFLLVIVFTLTCLVTYHCSNRGKINQIIKTIDEYNTIGDYDTVIDLSKKILSENPMQYRTHFTLGATYVKKK